MSSLPICLAVPLCLVVSAIDLGPGHTDQGTALGQSFLSAARMREFQRADQTARRDAKYSSLSDSLDPFIQVLGTALDDTSRGHYLGIEVPRFSVPLAERQTHDKVPYKAFYDMDAQAYRGGEFLSYLSREPVPKEHYHEIPCGPRELRRNPDPQVAPQDVWDGNVITAWLADNGPKANSQLRRGSSILRKDLVVLLNFVHAGYFGHMADNGFSRVAFAAEAAQQHGYKLFVLIPREELVHGPQSMGHVREIIEHVFDGKLVIPGVTEDQLPAHCTDAESASGDAVCRFFMTCGLPSFHVLPRQRFVQLAQAAVARYQGASSSAALLQVRPQHTKNKPFVHFARGDGFNSKGDERLSPLLAQRLEASGRWDIATGLTKWSLMELADFTSGHRSTLNVEGSSAYHVWWIGLASAGDEERLMVELLPDGSVTYDKWLWAYVLGMKHKTLFFDKGTDDVDSILRQVPELL